MRSISHWRLLSLAGACLVVLLFASPGAAQGIVQGTVVDANNQPVEGALVTIVSKDSSRKFQLKTDKKGEFFQIGVPSGAMPSGGASANGSAGGGSVGAIFVTGVGSGSACG